MTPGRQRTLLWVGFTLAAYGRQQGAALEYASADLPRYAARSAAQGRRRGSFLCACARKPSRCRSEGQDGQTQMIVFSPRRGARLRPLRDSSRL